MKKYILVALILGFVSCSSFPDVKEKTENEKKTGIYVAATHSPLQWILYFSNGLNVWFNDADPKIVPYKTEAQFFELKEGAINYKVEMTYLSGGRVVGCLNLKPGQKAYFKYSTPFLITSSGNLNIFDVKTETELPMTPYCK
ncbi:hypothetical protein LPTSP3_g11440 [Leptospira kobayashii]|uniref:Lipoprotein n=1 Tax=Leptospira kobayashii TaxID=1917830 RepID=A0ABN6KBA1_9LEPT|nr:hypothetical protein [Leptospira kobayashii]BDA78214.1 hypothetical protein LPTSP3_g11440 [Leptospira kobayashii]